MLICSIVRSFDRRTAGAIGRQPCSAAAHHQKDPTISLLFSKKNTMSFKSKFVLAAQPDTERGHSASLSADAQAKKFIYCNGRAVVIRDLAHPELASEYTEHQAHTTVARWSPSGFYIASADVQGNVRIWDTVNEEHVLKAAHRPIAARINDLCWDSDSKRIICVGEGKERFGKAFGFDTGSSVGEIVGHSKVANSCDIRPNRPFRAATCSDDMTVNFYNGVPYRFVKSISDHSRFVQSVRFSPDGNHLISAGSDCKMFLYTGANGEKVGEFSREDAHTGGILCASWNSDSNRILTSSMDKTCKIWDVETMKPVSTIKLGDSFEYQQVANLWAKNYLVSLSLSGELNYIDPRSPGVSRVVYGHQNSIKALSVNLNDKTLFTGSYDGRVMGWSTQDYLARPLNGTSDSPQISGMSYSEGKLNTVAYDDTFRSFEMPDGALNGADISNCEDMKECFSIPLGAQPRALSTRQDVSVCVMVNEICVIASERKTSVIKPSFTPSCVDLSHDLQYVAVGAEDKRVYLYKLSSDEKTLTEQPVKTFETNRGAISAVAFSPNGKYLACGDSDRKIVVYDVESGQVAFDQWVFHSSRVLCLNWSSDSRHAVSGGLDRDIYVWSTEKPMKFIAIKGAHQEGVSGVSFVECDEGTMVVSSGLDASVKVWELKFHE